MKIRHHNDFSRLRHPRSMRQVDGQEFSYLRPDLTFRNDGRHRSGWVPLVVAIVTLLWACAVVVLLWLCAA